MSHGNGNAAWSGPDYSFVFQLSLSLSPHLIHWVHNSTAGHGVHNNRKDLKHFREGLCYFCRDINIYMYIFFLLDALPHLVGGGGEATT